MKSCRPKTRTLRILSKQATVWESHHRSDTVACATGSAEHCICLLLRFRTDGRLGTGSCRCAVAVGIGVCRCRLVSQPGKLVVPRSLDPYSPSFFILFGSGYPLRLCFRFVWGTRTTTIAGFSHDSTANKQPEYWYRAATVCLDTFIVQLCSSRAVGGDTNIMTVSR